MIDVQIEGGDLNEREKMLVRGMVLMMVSLLENQKERLDKLVGAVNDSHGEDYFREKEISLPHMDSVSDAQRVANEAFPSLGIKVVYQRRGVPGIPVLD